jgi:hypothetical protein
VEPHGTLQDAPLPDASILTHTFEGIHEELGSDSHESNGDHNSTEADPRVDFRLRLRELAFFFSEGIWGGRVEFERIVFAGRIGQEDARAYITNLW